MLPSLGCGAICLLLASSHNHVFSNKCASLAVPTQSETPALSLPRELLKTFDANDDGVLQFGEFLDMWPRMKGALQVDKERFLPIQVPAYHQPQSTSAIVPPISDHWAHRIGSNGSC